MIFFLLLVAFVVAAILAAVAREFGMARPAGALVVLGIVGAFAFIIGVDRVESEAVGNDPVALLPVIGGLAMLLSTIGLLALAILWAWRRWSTSERTER